MTPTDGRTDRHSVLYSRVHATKYGIEERHCRLPKNPLRKFAEKNGGINWSPGTTRKMLMHLCQLTESFLINKRTYAYIGSNSTSKIVGQRWVQLWNRISTWSRLYCSCSTSLTLIPKGGGGGGGNSAGTFSYHETASTIKELVS